MLSFDIALLIVDFVAISDPTYPILIVLLWKGQWLEAIAEQWLLLDQIDDIELDSLVLLCIGNLEVEPLIMSSCIDIIMQYQVIGLVCVAFIIVLVYVEEVAALEVRIKDETAIVVFCWWLGSLRLDLWEVVAFGFGF